MTLEVGTRSLLASDSLTPSESGSDAAAEIPATIYHWTGLRRRSSPDFLEWEVSRTGGLLVRQDDAKLRSQHAPSSGLNQSGVHSSGMGGNWVDGGTRETMAERIAVSSAGVGSGQQMAR
ncbi:hypothetical protein ASPBRDRAFT_56298 [Aspergillus brasiliensis CBS 101740]|uniref:Uncharacterized protein n=1 Tax=Aspergillus brasiliensis (strain CBS 101740 / IMI 381727 / IBT 21946) TaxID=767769 RepID=A0A1L9UFR3_ASPBC|nr:hypothetical protein ASPBRDRAFT_56298 [Aspergillus brasiliensis CBS 101740]